MVRQGDSEKSFELKGVTVDFGRKDNYKVTFSFIAFLMCPQSL